MIDLTPTELQLVQTMLGFHVPGCEVRAFGSRVRWTSKPWSDLDLVVMSTPIAKLWLGDLQEALDESELPFAVDILVWDQLNPAFRAVIEQEFVVLQEARVGLKEDGVGSMSTWHSITLGSVIDIKHGYAFPGKGITKEETNNILVTPGNFKVGGGFKSAKIKYFDGIFPDEYILSEGDLIITMTDLSCDGDTLGYPALVPVIDGKKILHNQRIGLVIIKSNDIFPDFLYWLMRSKTYRFYVLGSATGSTVRHTSPNRIKQIKLDIPSNLQEQNSIAGVLSALDEKIAINQQQNCTLETIAQTLFKHWFVDFEFPDENDKPYRSNGGAMKPSEFGEIPISWEVKPFSHIVNLIGGGTPKTSVSEYWNGDIPWFSVIDAPNAYDTFVIDTVKKITSDGVANSSVKLLQPGTTIISARGTVGRIAIVGRQMAMNQSCYGVQGKLDNSDYFTYLSLQDSLDKLKANAHGSVFDTITKATFDSLEVLKPENHVIQDFEQKVSSIFKKLLSNCENSSILHDFRDTLLPKLMSGELSVGAKQGINSCN